MPEVIKERTVGRCTTCLSPRPYGGGKGDFSEKGREGVCVIKNMRDGFSGAGFTRSHATARAGGPCYSQRSSPAVRSMLRKRAHLLTWLDPDPRTRKHSLRFLGVS